MSDSHSHVCPDREPDLERYLFGELDPVGRVELERHLQECAGCRTALGEARTGLGALHDLAVAPLPFLTESPTGPRPFKRYLQPLAAAALLLVGLGLGRWLFPAPDVRGRQGEVGPAAGQPAFSVEAEAVDALARAELLADLGTTWVEGVLELMGTVMELEPGSTREAELERLRGAARRLIQDGRLLTRRLDPGRDAVFLSAIGRAEFILEDVAGIGGGEETDWSLGQIRHTLAMTGLDDRLIALDMDAAVTEALEASGWIGEEYRTEILSREVQR